MRNRPPAGIRVKKGHVQREEDLNRTKTTHPSQLSLPIRFVIYSCTYLDYDIFNFIYTSFARRCVCTLAY